MRRATPTTNAVDAETSCSLSHGTHPPLRDGSWRGGITAPLGRVKFRPHQAHAASSRLLVHRPASARLSIRHHHPSIRGISNFSNFSNHFHLFIHSSDARTSRRSRPPSSAAPSTASHDPTPRHTMRGPASTTGRSPRRLGADHGRSAAHHVPHSIIGCDPDAGAKNRGHACWHRLPRTRCWRPRQGKHPSGNLPLLELVASCGVGTLAQAATGQGIDEG